MGLVPRPFPAALRVGVDVVSIARWTALVRRALLATHAQHQHQHQALLAVTRRWLTPFEVSQVAQRPDAAHLLQPRRSEVTDESLQGIAYHLAGRWAAKEAVIKAVKPRRLTLRDVELRRAAGTGEVFAIVIDEPVPLWRRAHYDDALRLTLHGKQTAVDAAFEYKEALSGQTAQISITHDGDYAVAVAMAIPDHTGSSSSP